MMMAQTAFLIQPSVRRRMVRAKLDLDQTEEQMDKVPAAEKILNRCEYESKGTSQLCFPKPMPTQTETMMDSAKMATCETVSAECVARGGGFGFGAPGRERDLPKPP